MASASNPRTTSLFLLLLAGLAGFVLYDGALIDSFGLSGVKGLKARETAIADSITLMRAQNDSAKAELAKGSAEDLRRRVELYQQSLRLLRTLVPEQNEVPNLLDDMSSRAKIRGVTLSQVAPLPVEAGPAPFSTYKYNVAVIGRYDQIGHFLADVASLRRIIVPVDVNLAPADVNKGRALGDTSGALLEAKFMIRTYVKSAQGEGEGDGR